jgi:hypothetical protein
LENDGSNTKIYQEDTYDTDPTVPPLGNRTLFLKVRIETIV